MAKFAHLLFFFVWNFHTFTYDTTQAVNVLAVFPSVWYSHYLYGRHLLQLLVYQPIGNQLPPHTITLISAYNSSSVAPLSSDPNINEISIPGLRDNWLEQGLSFNVEHLKKESVLERLTRLIYAGATNVDILLSDPQVKALLECPQQHYDLLIVDLFLSEALLGLSNYYDIPAVVISPDGPNAWLNRLLGNPQSSALDPSNFLPYSEQMTLKQRSINTLMNLFERLTYNFFHTTSQQTVYAKHFKPLNRLSECKKPLPHHRELAQNVSLVLLNSHPVLQYPRAYLPNMQEIGGLYQCNNKQLLPLPSHLEHFISGAQNGVIYMSLGANLRTADLAREKLEAFLHVFETMHDMRVLLKWELENFDATLPDNVFLSEWLPQTAILAHKNVKIFITTGGVMSLMEAITTETLLLTIPIYPAQEVAAQRLQKQGCSQMLPFESLNYVDLLRALTTLRSNYTSHHKCIQQQRQLFCADSAIASPAKKALHYIDLVLLTNGATHLKTHANQFSFFQNELLDVLLVILAGISCIIAVPFIVICCILRKSYNTYLLNNNVNISKSSISVPSSYHIAATRDSMHTLSSGYITAECNEPSVSKRRHSTTPSSNSSTASSSPIATTAGIGGSTAYNKRESFGSSNTSLKGESFGSSNTSTKPESFTS